MFIKEPFIKCPSCGKDTFGVLSIHDNSYMRECNNCNTRKQIQLPELDKKIIYLDQFVISNFMKSLHPKEKQKRENLDKYWINLFKKINCLCNGQLIICPISDSHTNESLLSSNFNEYKKIYELFGHNTSFYDFVTIENMNINSRTLGRLKKYKLQNILINGKKGIITLP